MKKNVTRLLAATTAATLLVTACGSDDDGAGEVTELEDGSSSGSASGSGSGSASGSGSGSSSGSASGSASSSGSSSQSGSATGISEEELVQETDNELIQDAVDGYRAYVQEQIAAMQAETAVFADFIRAGDIEGAKGHYQISRRPWERIEPIAGLIEDIDGAVDARADDGIEPTDPDFTGWHRLEYHLWLLEDVSEAGPYADQLEADLATLAGEAASLELPPGVLTVGAQELIEEVAAPDGKLSGEEERYSETDLFAFQANVEGSEALVDLLRPALEEADAELLASIDGLFDELYGQLFALGNFDDGYPPYSEVTDEQRNEFAATLGELAEQLSLLNGTLGLE